MRRALKFAPEEGQTTGVPNDEEQVSDDPANFPSSISNTGFVWAVGVKQGVIVGIGILEQHSGSKGRPDGEVGCFRGLISAETVGVRWGPIAVAPLLGSSMFTGFGDEAGGPDRFPASRV